jgi:hypothetical protein
VENIGALEDRSMDQEPAWDTATLRKGGPKMMLYEEHPKGRTFEMGRRGAVELQQRHKEPRPEAAATTGKQRKCQQGPETDHSAGGCQLAAASSVKIPKMRVSGHCGGSGHRPSEKRDCPQLECQRCRSAGHSPKCSHRSKKKK